MLLSGFLQIFLRRQVSLWPFWFLIAHENKVARTSIAMMCFSLMPAKNMWELSPNLGDGLRDQAAAVWDCEDAGLAATSIPSVNLTP